MIDPTNDPLPKITEPRGQLAICGQCRKPIGEFYFAAPCGFARIFVCPHCGVENDFIGGAMGVSQATREARKKTKPASRI